MAQIDGAIQRKAVEVVLLPVHPFMRHSSLAFTLQQASQDAPLRRRPVLIGIPTVAGHPVIFWRQRGIAEGRPRLLKPQGRVGNPMQSLSHRIPGPS